MDLLEASRKVNLQAAVARRRRNRRADDDVAKRVSNAEALVRVEELSSARQALDGSSLAPGSETILIALSDPSKSTDGRRSAFRLGRVWVLSAGPLSLE